MSIVSTKDSERFYLKLVLRKIKEVTCFKDLLTVDKIFYKTYKEAALALGLIENDEHIYKVFDKVCKIMLHYQLRKFFVCFFLAENIQGNIIWEKLKNLFQRIIR